MKKRLFPILFAVAMLVIMSGCGKKATSDTLTISSKGKLTFEEISAGGFATEDQAELDRYVKDLVDDAEGVTLKECTISDSTAYVSTVYKSFPDFIDFTGINMFVGTLQEAKAAGYPMDKSMNAVVNGVISTSDISASTLDSQLKCVIFDGYVSVKVPGEVAYLSTGPCQLTSKDTVEIYRIDEREYDGANLMPIYIVYR